MTREKRNFKKESFFCPYFRKPNLPSVTVYFFSECFKFVDTASQNILK